ncbi:HD domain-containing phosphohydrolase [Methylogaea oryzae]|uniref:Two-component system response regulator n=1 Tax=Methylogaea oryzae TaxID=1295382 RepID=A0A8D5AIU4_9GAMM|nr:HD domain-containing phosphohydrolase [Methylogaea oryzae]BBL71726.1 two-component system response regulator [Methylogaea oryzae]
MNGLEQKIFDARILIVDDNRANIALLEKLLRKGGYSHVDSVSDPREVKALYEANRYDLILLDIRMPHLDGFQVMAQLRESKGDDYLSILVLTAELTSETKLRSLQEGAKDFLSKPFDSVEVLARARNLLEVRMFHNWLRDENRVLEEQVRQRTQELEYTRLEIIRRLGRAAEYRDNETGAHVIRMSKFCALLGGQIGLSEEECELLLNASPMHDIGKIGIPDRILLKPGKLDPDEWDIMKTHAAIGAEMLSGHDSTLLQMAEIIAATHHERWDGSGYPKGLKGEDIPLVGRITAVCDVFDALTSERPYKKAWSVEEALAEMEKLKGSHFDPILVDRFHDILPQVLQIKQQFLD